MRIQNKFRCLAALVPLCLLATILRAEDTLQQKRRVDAWRLDPQGLISVTDDGTSWRKTAPPPVPATASFDASKGLWRIFLSSGQAGYVETVAFRASVSMEARCLTANPTGGELLETRAFSPHC